MIRSNILKLEDLSQMKESNLKIAEQITEQFKNISFVNFKWIFISLFGVGSFFLLTKFITIKKHSNFKQPEQTSNNIKTNNLIDNIKTFIKVKFKSIYNWKNPKKEWS